MIMSVLLLGMQKFESATPQWLVWRWPWALGTDVPWFSEMSGPCKTLAESGAVRYHVPSSGET